VNITGDQVSFRYEPEAPLILDRVMFSLSSGDFVLLIGTNGAGKTTLIHLVAGLRRPSSGQILVGGANPLEKATRRKMGFVPERPYFHDFLTGQQILEFFGKLSGLSGSELSGRIDATLKTVKMEHARAKELRHYSKGMLQRIGIAQAILHDPDVLVLDEPFSGLDPKGQRELVEIVRQVQAAGKTVFLSSHWLGQLSQFCTHFAAIQGGRLAETGPVAGRSEADFEAFFEEGRA
jgi:ABC-2 type transport system ATP-binding protein